MQAKKVCWSETYIPSEHYHALETIRLAVSQLKLSRKTFASPSSEKAWRACLLGHLLPINQSPRIEDVVGSDWPA